MARKEYTYNLIDKNGQTVCQDRTRVDLILLLGADLNLGNCAGTRALVKGRYQLERCREFERENTLDDKILAEFEVECRKWRGTNVIHGHNKMPVRTSV